MTPQEAAAAGADARIISGYHVLLSDDMRRAHAAVLAHADAHNDDYWPKGRDVVRFARFCRVSPSALGGLVSLIRYQIGRKTVWVDAAHIPDVARRVGMDAFGREAMVSFGIFRAAAATLDGEAATVH